MDLGLARSASGLLALVLVTVVAVAQTRNEAPGQAPTQPPGQLDQGTEDFDAPAAFPLAAPAGVDSRAIGLLIGDW